MKNKNIDFGKMPTILPKGYLKQSIDELSTVGLPQGLYTGVKNLDNIFRLDKGRLITITGVPNYGKSEFVDFLTTTYNKKYGMKTLYFSPENQPVSFHLTKLMAKYTGKKFSPDTYTPEEINSAVDYIGENFFFMNYERVTRLEDILTLSEGVIKDRDVGIIVIDAYNKIDSDRVSSEMETEFIGKLLDKLCRFAIKHNIMIFLVAHPRKMDNKDKNLAYPIPNAYDINGSAHFFNKSDFVLTVHRDIQKDEVLIRVSKVKFSNYGKQGDCMLKYDIESGNYFDNTFDPYAFLDGDENENGYVHIPFVFPTKTIARNPLDVEVSYYKGASDNVGTPVKLKDFLFTDKFKGIAEDIRQKATPEERHDYKKTRVHEIPAITISGLFKIRDGKSLVSPSGLMCIDIDHKDNTPETMAKVPDILKSLPYVCYASKSISGDGYFAIVPLENPKHFKQHYHALEEEMRSYGIIIDKSCKDITRLRFATYDDAYYYNPAASSFYLEVDTTQPLDRKQTKQFVSSSTQSDEDKVKTEIEFIRNNNISLPDDYDTWFKLAMSLNSSLGENGRKYFHELSSMSDKYDKYECDNQYDEVLNHYSEGSEVSLGTFFHIVNNAKV